MKKAFMKSKFYIGIALLVQAFTMIILFFTQLRKSKSLAVAFLAVAAAAGSFGTYLVVSGSQDEEEKNEMLEALREDFFEINEDDVAEDEDAIFITDVDLDDVDDDDDEEE